MCHCTCSFGTDESLPWNLEAIMKDGDDEYEIAHPRPHAGEGRAAGGVRMKSGEGEDKRQWMLRTSLSVGRCSWSQ